MMMHSKHFLLYSSLLLTIATFTACGKKQKKINLAEQTAKNAAEMHRSICLAHKAQNKDLEVELLEKSIKEFPESKYLADYTLRLADLYLETEHLQQAYHIYDTFALLHPTHARAEEAAYKAIVAQFRQTLKIHRDCDSSSTEETVKLCNNFLFKLGASKYAEHVTDILTTCKERLIEKETYIFQQYIQEGKYQSASKRLEKIKKQSVNDLERFEARILFLECLLAQAEQQNDDLLARIETLQEKHPESPFTLMATNITKKRPFLL